VLQRYIFSQNHRLFGKAFFPLRPQLLRRLTSLHPLRDGVLAAGKKNNFAGEILFCIFAAVFGHPKGCQKGSR